MHPVGIFAENQPSRRLRERLFAYFLVVQKVGRRRHKNVIKDKLFKGELTEGFVSRNPFSIIADAINREKAAFLRGAICENHLVCRANVMHLFFRFNLKIDWDTCVWSLSKGSGKERYF